MRKEIAVAVIYISARSLICDDLLRLLCEILNIIVGFYYLQIEKPAEKDKEKNSKNCTKDEYP